MNWDLMWYGLASLTVLYCTYEGGVGMGWWAPVSLWGVRMSVEPREDMWPPMTPAQWRAQAATIPPDDDVPTEPTMVAASPAEPDDQGNFTFEVGVTFDEGAVILTLSGQDEDTILRMPPAVAKTLGSRLLASAKDARLEAFRKN